MKTNYKVVQTLLIPIAIVFLLVGCETNKAQETTLGEPSPTAEPTVDPVKNWPGGKTPARGFREGSVHRRLKTKKDSGGFNSLIGIGALLGSTKIKQAIIYRLPTRLEQAQTVEAPYYFYLLITSKNQHGASALAALNAYTCEFDAYEGVAKYAKRSTLIPFIAPMKGKGPYLTKEQILTAYNITDARQIHSYLGEKYQDESVMIVGIDYPIDPTKRHLLSTLEKQAVVIGLSNRSEAEINQLINAINRKVIKAKNTRQLATSLDSSKENLYTRNIKTWLRSFASAVLPIKPAVAQDACG